MGPLVDLREAWLRDGQRSWDGSIALPLMVITRLNMISGYVNMQTLRPQGF